MDLRLATWEDIPQVLDLTSALTCAIDGPQSVDRAHTGAIIAGFIQSDDGLVLLSGDGFIAANLMPTIINPAAVAFEAGWFARDGSGLRLLRAFEAWADSKEASLKVISTRGRDMSRFGYRPKEEAWVK